MLTSSRRLSALNPLSYPIWLKLTLGFALVVVLVILPALFLLSSGVEAIALQNARSFLSENGTRQLSSVASSFERARANLDRFVETPFNNRQLVGALLGNAAERSDIGLVDVNPADTAALMESILLNPATSLYDNVRLLDRDGQVVALAGLAPLGVSLIDQSQTAAYQVAAGDTTGETSLLVISQRGFPVLEFVHKIYWRDNSVIGYMVTQLSNARAVYANLRFRFPNDEPFEAYAFLIDEQAVQLTPVENREQAANSLASEGVRRALDGQSGLEVYSPAGSENNPNAEVIGYFAPVPGTTLALVSELSLDSVRQDVLSFLPLRGAVVAIGWVGMVIVLGILFNQLFAPPLARLRRAALGMIGGDYETPLPDVRRGDEFGEAASAFVQMRSRMKTMVDELESRVALRTRDIEATQEISRYAATQRDANALMRDVVNLIVQRFPAIYHAQIFLIDADRQYAVVRASTGEVGRQLLERGHRLGVGSVSVIGQVTDQGRYILAKDAAVSQVHRRNEFLPDTRSELAIPLRVGETIIGALDVQSKQSDAFPDDMIRVLETMADNIAIAIENARLYEESVRRVREIEDTNREATRRAWQDYLRDQRVLSLSREAGVPLTQDDTISELRRRALATGEIAVGDQTGRNTYPVAVPIQLRGQTLGAVEWELPAGDFSREKLELARELANRLALSLDNTRLFQESRRATERERLVNTIAARLTAQTSIDQILQTAVREVGQALRAPQVTIRLKGSESAAGLNQPASPLPNDHE
ncbi:MAG: GAF domain-containing protein [bacterium]|nr:GAF domain-containing protein [bacterium]